MPRPTQARINLTALRHNFARSQSNSPSPIAVVKADAYGHGMVEVARALVDEGATVFAVAFVDEALRLRDAGITKPVLILEGPFTEDELALCLVQDLWPVLHSPHQLAWLMSKTQRVKPSQKIWIKLDTGMHRLGLSAKQWRAFVDSLNSQARVWWQQHGVLMTHFSSADSHPALTQQQRQQFLSLAQRLPMALSDENSAACLSSLSAHDYARVGITLYGGAPNNKVHTRTALGLKPVMSLIAPVMAIRELRPGEQVGYAGTWAAQRTSVIATVAIGYADGYPRHASNQAHVYIDGYLCPVVGRVSMDMITVDITDALQHTPVGIGTCVECWGEHLAVETVAQAAGTIQYELLTRVSDRVPRIYISP